MTLIRKKNQYTKGQEPTKDVGMSGKPDWFKIPMQDRKQFKKTTNSIVTHRLHSICEEGLCPNRNECYSVGTASFLILGDICTRACKYCSVKTGKPTEYDLDESQRLRDAVLELGLKYVVVTSVTRDDLDDGGASVYVDVVEKLREIGVRVELLIPDFAWNDHALQVVIDSRPEVLGHNIECVRSVYSKVRPQGNYDKVLELLKKISKSKKTIAKTAFMVGVGETREEISALLLDLLNVGVQRLSVGQYLRPSQEHWPVHKYYSPDEFKAIKKEASNLGFSFVEAGPLVRSSYHAESAGK